MQQYVQDYVYVCLCEYLIERETSNLNDVIQILQLQRGTIYVHMYVRNRISIQCMKIDKASNTMNNPVT